MDDFLTFFISPLKMLNVKVSKESIKYTSFITPFGQYLFMPFGIKVGPLVFQRFVNNILSELIRSGDIVIYIDDILVATTTLEHHFEVLRKLFKLMVQNQLEMNQKAHQKALSQY